MIKDLNKRLYAYAMFDGHLAFMGGSNNACLVINMLEEHKDYLDRVIQTLEELPVGFNLSAPKIYKADGFERGQQLRLQSHNHPIFTKIHARMYIDKHKVFDPHMGTLLDAEMLAIAFMADGSCYRDKRWANSKPTYRLHLNNWTYGDLLLFKECVKREFGLEINTRKKGLRYDLAVPTFHSELFEEIVRDHILPSFQYKIER